MAILGELAALCLVVSGFLIMLGLGYHLLYGTVILVVLAPLNEESINLQSRMSATPASDRPRWPEIRRVIGF